MLRKNWLDINMDLQNFADFPWKSLGAPGKRSQHFAQTKLPIHGFQAENCTHESLEPTDLSILSYKQAVKHLILQYLAILSS
jgi:hypothetical protein